MHSIHLFTFLINNENLNFEYLSVKYRLASTFIWLHPLRYSKMVAQSWDQKILLRGFVFRDFEQNFFLNFFPDFLSNPTPESGISGFFLCFSPGFAASKIPGPYFFIKPLFLLNLFHQCRQKIVVKVNVL